MKKLKNSPFLVLIILVVSLIVLNSCGGVPEEKGSGSIAEENVFSVDEVLEMVSKENDVTRTLYTKAIVGKGKLQGMKFDEDWRKDDVEAGPLPALFLRGVATSIRKGPVPLGLYLGSDFPINNANKFEGEQESLFEDIKVTQEPKFFYDESQELHTAMFADLASAQACVTCHNDHPQTAKTDWKLGDVMGATTWQYPKDSLTYSGAVEVLNAYAQGTVDIYVEYLDEIAAFKSSEKPIIGDKWPAEGNYLPSPEVFLDSVRKLSSYDTMKTLIASK
ncbi:DUF3365 domain-containing protein [Maribacter sp. SA7]|uniref:c-type heme family protein n=1 Tax=Maribacter zhoushanensis TaxID=3030012 RepID=UPI0023EC6FC4|nr:DUF3365 domain-containing protein [Maribacter zhoushanensis]MDF4201377.1 DUF3365 domain-containing protein [Maribacter zhoushanensis]